MTSQIISFFIRRLTRERVETLLVVVTILNLFRQPVNFICECIYFGLMQVRIKTLLWSFPGVPSANNHIILVFLFGVKKPV